MLVGVCIFTFAYLTSAGLRCGCVGSVRWSSRALAAGLARRPWRRGRAPGAGQRRDRPCSRVEVLGKSVRRPPDPGLAPGPAPGGVRRGHPDRRADLDDARQRAGDPADPGVAARRRRRSTRSTCGWCRSTTPTGWPRTRARNAHGVDLNRNYPYDWVDLDGSYESGPKPASEPETRAMMRFLRKIRPGLRPQLPPAAERRGHQHRSARRSPARSPGTSTCRRPTSTAAGSATAP